MVRNDIKNSSLLKTKFLIYAFNGRTFFIHRHATTKTESCYIPSGTLLHINWNTVTFHLEQNSTYV